MGIYVMRAEALKELLEQHMPDANDFGNEVIPGEGREMVVGTWPCSASYSMMAAQ